MQSRLFLLLAALFLLLTSREPPWADAHVVYDTTQSFVDHGDFAVRIEGGPPWFYAHPDGKPTGLKYGVRRERTDAALRDAVGAHRAYVHAEARAHAACERRAPVAGAVHRRADRRARPRARAGGSARPLRLQGGSKDDRSHADVLLEYGSGLRTGNDNEFALPPHVTIDAMLWHRFDVPSQPEVAVDVLNVLDNRYAYRIATARVIGSACAPGRQCDLRLVLHI